MPTIVPEGSAGEGLKQPPAAGDEGSWERPQVVGGRSCVLLPPEHSTDKGSFLCWVTGAAALSLGQAVKMPISMKPELEMALPKTPAC